MVMSELSPTTPVLQQQNATPDEGTDNLLKRFAVTRRVSLLVLLITIALLLAFILASFFIGWLREFSLGLLPIAIPLAFIIARWVYRQLKDTNVPLYVITLVGMLLVTGTFCLGFIYGGFKGSFWLLLIESVIAGAVFALALFLTSLGHLYYQITMKRRGYQLSRQQIWSSLVALVILLLVIAPLGQGLIGFLIGSFSNFFL